jgi:hypothetical protein
MKNCSMPLQGLINVVVNLLAGLVTYATSLSNKPHGSMRSTS